jgi:hypothetical protein
MSLFDNADLKRRIHELMSGPGGPHQFLEALQELASEFEQQERDIHNRPVKADAWHHVARYARLAQGKCLPILELDRPEPLC